MIKHILILSMLFTTMCSSASEDFIYRLGPGDEINIVVYDEPDLTVNITINNDGNINFPLIGLIAVTGRSAPEIQKIVHDKLQGDYLLSPSVQVDIVSYRPFYIHGEVKSPGAYPYEPGLNVDQAIALGGGLTERASVSKIYIKQKNNKSKDGTKVKLNQAVSPGDIINIEQSFF